MTPSLRPEPDVCIAVRGLAGGHGFSEAPPDGQRSPQSHPQIWIIKPP